MTPLCWLAMLGCFAAGIGITLVLWAASGISGREAEQERSADE